MIQVENVQVMGWEAAIRGMRNPRNSWEKSDSYPCFTLDEITKENHSYICSGCRNEFVGRPNCIVIGENDFNLMTRLCNAGTDHRKFMRMVTVYVDITAPLYWWKEFDTYKIGTVANSCSTMHKITEKEFTLDDFSIEHLDEDVIDKPFRDIIDCLNFFRDFYNANKDKNDWWQIIQLLPSSYNQKRTVMLNYEVLYNIYHSRKNHKLDEWREFCEWVETLPYSQLITEQGEIHD